MRGTFTRSAESRAASRPWCRCACIAATLAVVFASPAVAQTTRYWAPDTGAGGSGTWNTADLFWAPNTDGSGTKVGWNSALTNNVAFFGGTAGTVTTGAAVSTNQIRFDTTGYLLAGDATNTITLNGTTPQVLLANGVAAEISAALAGSAGISTGASGTTGGTLTLSGTSTLTGTASFGAGEVVLATGGSLTAGTLNVGTGLAGATSTLRIKSGAAFSASGSGVVGTNSLPTAAVVQEGGTATFGGSLVLGTNTSSGTYSGSSSYTLQGGSLNLISGTNSFVTVGRNATATFTQTGGTVMIGRTTDALTIGDYASGSYSITAGSLTMIGDPGSSALLGFRGGSGTLDIGGTAAVRIRGSLFLAVNQPNSTTNKGSATVNLQGGDLAVNGITRGRAGTTGSNGAGSVSFTLSGGTLRPYSGNVSFGSATAGSNFDITLSGTAATISGLDASATPAARTVDLYANLVGSGGVTLSGGTINLRGTNTYSGGTTIGTGTVAILATSAVPASGTYTILSGGTLADSSGFATVGGWLASGRIATASAGTLAFTAATESDAINLTGYDSLVLAATGTTEVSGAVTPSATGLRIGGTGTLTISSALGGSAGVTKTGTGTLVLSGANTYQGATSLAAGTITAASATALGTGGTISFEGGTLRYGSGVTTDFSGRISPTAGQNVRVDVGGQTVEWATGLSGTGTQLTRSGTGTLTLTAANTHTGGTTLTGAGETVVAATGSLTGPGSILIGTGSGTSTLRIASGAIVSAASLTVGTGTNQNAALIQEGGDVTASSVLRVGGESGTTAYAGSATYDLQGGSITLTGQAFFQVGRNSPSTFTQSGGTVTIARANDAALNIGNYSSGTYTLTGGSLTAASTGANLALATNGGGSGTLTINGPTARMGLRGTGTLAAGGGTATVNLQQGELAINGLSRGTAGVVNFNLAGGTLRPFDANVAYGSATTGNNFDVTLTGTGSVISGLDATATPVARTVDLFANLGGSGGVTLSGGTINLRGTNTYSGGTTIAGGLANFATSTAVPATGTFTLTGGGTFSDSAETLTVAGWLASGRIATASAGAIAFGSGTAASSDALDFGAFPDLALGAVGATTYSGGLTPAAGGYRFAASGTLTVASTLTGSVGVTASGSGTTLLTAANDYTGPTSLAGGTLTARSAAALGNGGTISFGGGTLGYASGVTTDFSARFATGPGQAYAVDTGGELVTWATPLDSSGGSLTKRGAGTLTLPAANAYDGPTAILGGTLVAGAGGSLGSGTISFGGGTLAYGSGVTTDFSGRFSTAASQAYRVDTAGQNVSWATPLVSAAGSLQKAGAGTLTLTADATFSGTTTISGGTLRLGDGGTTGLVAGGIVNDGSLAVDRSTNLTLANAISGSGGLVKAGSGTLTLTGSNTFSGPTAIVGGTLSINSSARLGTAPASPAPGQLSLVGSTLQTTALVTLSANTGVALAGTSRFSITGGRLTTNGVIADGSAAGSLAISGSSDWTPASQSTYTGGTTLEPGVTIILGANSTGDPGSVVSGPFGTGPLTLAGAAIRSGNDADRTVANNVSIAGDTLFPTVSGEKSLTFTAPATLASTRTLDVGVGSTVSASTVTFAAAIGDGGAGHGLTKTGAGRLVLAGDNTYTGTTTVSAGSLDIGSGGTTGSLAGNLATNGMTRFNRSDALTYAGGISGTGSLTQLGTGTLTLSGSNTHQGGTTLSAGGLNLGSATAIGTGTFTISAGTLGNSSGGPLALATNNPLTLGGNFTFAGPHDLDLGTGAGTLAAARTVTVDAGTLTLRGAIAGSGGLTKQGPGRLVLAGANTFTGAVTVSGGEFTLAGGTLAGNATRTVGSATGPASVLRIQAGSSVGAGSFQIGNATIPNAAVIQEGGDLTVSTALQLANSGLASTYAGNSTYELQGGSITFTGTGFLQVGRNATSSFTQSGGTIAIATTGNSLTVGDYAAGSYTMTAGSLAATTAGGNLLVGNRGGAGTLTINGPTARMAFNGAGRFAINDSSTTGSSASVNLLAGELALNSMSRVSSAGTVNFTLGGGTLRPYGANATFGSSTAANNFEIALSGTGSVISGLDAAATPVARTVDLRTLLIGSGGVTLSGGTINLHAANTHSGPTTIAAGTSVALPGSLANSSAVTVNGSLSLATKTTGFAFGSGQTLGGAGTVGLPTTGPGVSLAGFLAPGNSPGTLTLSGAGTFDITSAINGTTGRLLFELGAPGVSAASDLVLVPDGTLAIGTNLLGFNSFAFTPLAGFTAGTYTLFSANTISGLLDPARTTGSVGGLSAELTASGTEISLIVVPEPATVALAGAGIIAAAVGLRRRPAAR
jgi:fibronectin-binding autotransporter adhesin